MIRFLIDMNLSPRWVEFLTIEGYQAVHWSSIGSPYAEDHEIMSYAAQSGFVIITADLGFSAILAATNDFRPSVVQIRSDDLKPERQCPSFVRAVRQFQGELESGALMTIDTGRQRVRLLPLQSKN